MLYNYNNMYNQYNTSYNNTSYNNTSYNNTSLIPSNIYSYYLPFVYNYPYTTGTNDNSSMDGILDNVSYIYNLNIKNIKDFISEMLMSKIYYDNIIKKKDEEIITNYFTECECQICYNQKKIYYMMPCCGNIHMCNDCIKDYLLTKKVLCNCNDNNCENKKLIKINCPFCKSNIKTFITNINNLEIKK
jgi:hypothetical protein